MLTAANPSTGTLIVLRWNDRWYASSLTSRRETVPRDLRALVEAGQPATQRVRVDGVPTLVTGLPLASAGASFYEFVPLAELDDTLRTLSSVLAGGAVLATAAGAVLGLRVSRAVVQPLNSVAGATAEIAAGQLATRLPPTSDPELATIVGSFNAMVDSLQQRIERDARLAADVSHELRSPLTTLVASVDVLNRRRAELPPRSQQALDLVTLELERFRRLLDNLLELSRAEAGGPRSRFEHLPVAELLAETLRRSERPPELLSGGQGLVIRGDKFGLERVFTNMFDNADRHGGGVAAVSVVGEAARVLVLVDDEGPGVPPADRSRIFDRFATGGGARGSSPGTGLGLALVAETVSAHGGAVWCTDQPGGGARFVVSLPRVRP
nr:HAMP domain-containing sensor histidine kinase [Actinopolymorpha pittospori]